MSVVNKTTLINNKECQNDKTR